MRHVFLASILFSKWCVQYGTVDPACVLDQDGDGYCVADDCDDADPTVNPGEVEEEGNCKDDDCNGTMDALPESQTLLDDGGVILCGNGVGGLGSQLLSADGQLDDGGLVIAAPRRNSSGAVYVLDRAALEAASGQLVDVEDQATFAIQGLPQNELGTSVGVLRRDDTGSSEIFLGAPGYQSNGLNTLGAVFGVLVDSQTGQLTLGADNDQGCPEGADFCLINTESGDLRLGEALVVGLQSRQSSTYPFLLASAPGFSGAQGAIAMLWGTDAMQGRQVFGYDGMPIVYGTSPSDSFGSSLVVATPTENSNVRAFVGAKGLHNDRGVQAGGVYDIPIDPFEAPWDEPNGLIGFEPMLYGDTANQQLGAALGVGDLDLDGYDDLLVGTQCATIGCQDHAFLVLGTETSGGTALNTSDLSLDVTWSDYDDGPAAGPAASLGVADVDGDGTPDIIIGRSSADDEAGATWVVFDPMAASGVDGSGTVQIDLDHVSVEDQWVAAYGPESTDPNELGYAMALARYGSEGTLLAVGVPRAFDLGGAVYGLPFDMLSATP